MTVAEYGQNFTRLSRFAKTLIKPELEKIRRFVRGLRYNIQKDVTSTKLTTYDENHKKAFRLEEFNDKISRMKELRCGNGPKLMITLTK